MKELTIELKNKRYNEQLYVTVSETEAKQVKYCAMVGQYKSVSDFVRSAVEEKLKKMGE